MSEYGTKPTNFAKQPCGHEWLPLITIAERSAMSHPNDPMPDRWIVTEVFCRFCLEVRTIGPAPEKPEKESGV